MKLDVAVAIEQFWRRDAGQCLSLLDGLTRFGNQRDVAMAAGVEVEELADAVFVLEKARLLAPSSLVRGFRLGDPRGPGEGEISPEASRAVRMVGVTRVCSLGLG